MTTLTYVVGDERHEVSTPTGAGALVIEVRADVWSSMCDGSLPVAVAYMQGKVKITGDQSALYDLLPDIPLPS